MKKILITVDNLNEYLCAQSGKLYTNSNMIITSGAKDLCSQRRIEIVYGNSAPNAQNCSSQNNFAQNNSVQNMLLTASKPTACCDGTSNAHFEQILLKLAVILKESYGITDIAQLRKLSMEAAKVIKNNL